MVESNVRKYSSFGKGRFTSIRSFSRFNDIISDFPSSSSSASTKFSFYSAFHSDAIKAVQNVLQKFKDQGRISEFSGPEFEGQVYVFTVYTSNPEDVENEIWEKVVSESRRHDVTMLVDVIKNA